MKTVRDHRSGDLFDPWAHLGPQRRTLLDKSWAGLMRKECAGRLPVEELAPFFCEGFGRPGKDLHVAMGALVLQELHDLTDPQTVEALAFSEAWHYALDARGESDKYLCERTLRNYRAKLTAHGGDEVLFRVLTDRLMKAFKVDATRQRLDSTAVCSNMRKLTRLGVVSRTIEKFLAQLQRADAGLYGQVDAALLGRYVKGEEAGCFGACKPSEAARRLPQAAADLLALTRAFAGTSAADLPGYKLLVRVLREHCEVIAPAGGEDEKLRVKEHRELTGNTLQNPSDPDATYNGHKGQGFMMQVMETYNPDDDDADADPGAPLKPDLITHVAIGSMTEHDGDAVMPALDDTAARGIKPQELTADTPYGTQDTRQAAAAVGVELVCPTQPPAGSQQTPRKLSLEQFVLDDEGRVKTCPAGHAPLSVSASEGGGNYQARFDAATCAACPLRAQCPVQNPRGARGSTTRLQYDRKRLAMRERRLEELQPGFKERYRWRAGIEATMSRLKHQVGLAKLRVRGLVSVSYQMFMGALGSNIWRCARCMTANPAG